MSSTSPVQEILARLHNVREHQGRDGWEARCPAHDDHKNSLGVATGDDGRVLLHCQAGCKTEDVVTALGLTMRDLYTPRDDETPAPEPRGKIARTYPYRDEAGIVRFQAVRYEPKRFSQRRPLGPDEWAWGLSEGHYRHRGGGHWTPLRKHEEASNSDRYLRQCDLMLYHLPELQAAPEDVPVFLVEGEKDVEALELLGLVATTNPMGAGKWRRSYSGTLRGRKVFIVPDNDDAGRRHAETVSTALAEFAASVTILTLPNLPAKGDVSDWLAAGGTAEQLLALAAAAPAARPPLTVQTPRLNADNSTDPLDQDATAADLILANATMRYAWDKWLPLGVLTVLASEPGQGKTRFCADLARRVYHALPWPDGTPATFPAGSRTLWVPADNQHSELGSLPTAFRFPPEALFLNATRRNPFSGTMLDDLLDLEEFEARIRRVRPALVFVDTTLNATDRSSHKPEDAKAFFVPLQQIAARCGIVLLGVTHLNAAGKPLGRRIQGQARLVMQLEKPDITQEHRRKLYVVKSNGLFPAALGITMGTEGNDYDPDPPVAPEPGSTPTRDPKTAEARDWLQQYLAGGPRRVHDARTAAEMDGIAPKTLYRAKASLSVEEYTEGGKKWWHMPADHKDNGHVSTPWDEPSD